MTGSDVLRRYKEEELPEFLGIPLADVNQRGNSGDRPLHVAAIRGNMDEILGLVIAGADLNAPGDLRNTPLHNAAAHGHVDAVKISIENGASPFKKNEFGESVFDFAQSHRHDEIATILRSWPDLADS